MALSIAPALAEKIAQKVKPNRRLVKFRRRSFDPDAQDFVLEAGFTQVLESDIRSISASREAVDRKGINRFEASNITIELENKDNKWSPKNASGLLGPPTPNAPFFEPQLMEFVVELFYTLEDGTESSEIAIFTGRAVAFDFRPDPDTVAITVESPAVLTKRADAENVSTPFTNEVALATGDPKVFETAVSGVARTGVKVKAVRVNGLPKSLGAAVVISQENDPDLPATLSFREDLGGSPDVRIDFIEWFKGLTPDALVGKLADEAGIGPALRVISEVVFPNFLILTRAFTNQEDFEAGILTNIDTTTTPGQFTIGPFLVDDFSNNDFVTDPVWTVVNQPVGTSVSAATGALVLSAASTISSEEVVIGTARQKNTGSWKWKGNSSIGAPTGFSTRVYFFVDSLGFTTAKGYSIQVNTNSNFQLKRITLGFNPGAGGDTTILQVNGDFRGQHTWIVRRNSVGRFEVFFDGVPQGTVIDTTFTTAAFSVVAADGSSTFPTTFTFDDFEFTDPVPGVFESPIFDAKNGFREWIKLITTSTTPGGTSILVETAVADESFPGSGVPGPFDAFIAVDGQDNIQSVNKRFIKIRITLDRTDPFDFITPIVFDTTLTFVGVTLEIALANLSGLTIFQAISELAKISNFEWGFLRDGKLFFRARTASITPVLTIELESLSSFSRITDGVDRVRNLIRARFGTHETVIDPISEGDAKPNSFDRNGRRSLVLSSTQLLLDLDANVATGLARSYFLEFKEPRRIFEVDIDLRPQLEVGDTVEFRVQDALPDPPWHIGDGARAIGDSDIALYGETQQSAFKIKARILSLRNDLGSMKTGIEAEEVL